MYDKFTMEHLIDFDQIVREQGIIYFDKNDALKLKYDSDVDKYLDDLNPTQHQFLYAYFLHSQMTNIHIRDTIDIFMLKKNQSFFRENKKLLIEFERCYKLDKITEKNVKKRKLLQEQKEILERCIQIKTAELKILENDWTQRKDIFDKFNSVDSYPLLKSIVRDLNVELNNLKSENIIDSLETNFRNFIQKQQFHRDLVCLFSFFK
jgi:hypothetical protein